METDCTVATENSPTRSGRANQGTCWRWLYEMRPPNPTEAIQTTAGGMTNIRLMVAATNPDTPFDDGELFDSLPIGDDLDNACAVAVLGMNSVFEAGADFNEFTPWLLRINQLLAQPELPAIGRSALLMHTAIAQLLGPGQLGDVQMTLEEFGAAAENADSDAQRMIHASLCGYCELMSGRPMVAESMVRDALFIGLEEGLHQLPRLHLKTTQGLILILRNNAAAARECLENVISTPDFDHLPSSFWLICMGHYLLALAVSGTQPGELEVVADKIRARSIPAHKHYHRSYMHYALGAASLLTGLPDSALFHAETAIEMARRCHSKVAERTATLLAIQALADLGQYERALQRLDASLERWQQAGAHLLIASGALEAARIHLELGHPAQAHTELDRARQSLPAGEPLPCNLRRPIFVSDLLERLEPPSAKCSPPQPDPRPIRINTFGELCVEINGRRLYDRDWHGTRTKTLLKALIVLGGYKVSAERLCDLLWPNADGDIARNNLKVALWRLRHLGCARKENPLPWVVIQHGHVSLVSGLCRIDSLEFQEAMKSPETLADANRLHAALAAIDDHFLASDDSETWIIEHREYLRQTYLQGIHALIGMASGLKPGADLQHLLQAARQLAPQDFRCHQLLQQLQSRSL